MTVEDMVLKLKETTIKYLAGIFDADASVGFSSDRRVKRNGKINILPTLSFCQGEAGYALVEWLAEQAGVPVNTNRQTGVKAIRLTGRKLSPLADRLVKFMVVKGSRLAFVVDYCREHKEVTIEEFRRIQEEARRLHGPKKPRNFVSSAWMAGWMDGDGYYTFRHRRNTVELSANCDVKIVEKHHALELIHKTYGGSLRKPGELLRWRLGLGKGNRARAMKFLKAMHKFSRIKREKTLMMLRFHRGRND